MLNRRDALGLSLVEEADQDDRLVVPSIRIRFRGAAERTATRTGSQRFRERALAKASNRVAIGTLYVRLLLASYPPSRQRQRRSRWLEIRVSREAEAALREPSPGEGHRGWVSSLLIRNSRRHSVRSADIGAMDAARAAGMRAAKNAHTASEPAATVSASGSQNETP
jgi:hypothetical protein